MIASLQVTRPRSGTCRVTMWRATKRGSSVIHDAPYGSRAAGSPNAAFTFTGRDGVRSSSGVPITLAPLAAQPRVAPGHDDLGARRRLVGDDAGHPQPAPAGQPQRAAGTEPPD